MATAKPIMLPDRQKDLTHNVAAADETARRPFDEGGMTASLERHQPVGPHHETAWSRAFALVLPLLMKYVEAEQDLEEINHNQDPALNLWQRDRDQAEARLTHALAGLRRLPVRMPEDRPLQRFVVLVCRMLDDHDLALPRRLHREMKASFFRDYQVSGIGPIARHRNGMLIQARHLVDAMIKLSFFDYLPEDTASESHMTQADATLLEAV